MALVQLLCFTAVSMVYGLCCLCLLRRFYPEKLSRLLLIFSRGTPTGLNSVNIVLLFREGPFLNLRNILFQGLTI